MRLLDSLARRYGVLPSALLDLDPVALGIVIEAADAGAAHRAERVSRMQERGADLVLTVEAE